MLRSSVSPINRQVHPLVHRCLLRVFECVQHAVALYARARPQSLKEVCQDSDPLFLLCTTACAQHSCYPAPRLLHRVPDSQ